MEKKNPTNSTESLLVRSTHWPERMGQSGRPQGGAAGQWGRGVACSCKFARWAEKAVVVFLFLWINVAGGVAYWKTCRCSSSTGSCSKPEPRINRFPTGSQYLIFLPLAAPIFDWWSRWRKEEVEDEEEEEAGLTPAQRCWSPPRQSASSRTAWRRTGRAAGPGGWSRCGLCSDDHIGPIQDWSSLKKLRSS